MRSVLSAALAAVCLAPAALGAAPSDGLKPGKVELQSAGPIAFAPGGVLFVGDPKAAAVVAIGTGDTAARPAAAVSIDDVSGKLAALLGVNAADVQVNDLAVNPASNRVYLSVSRGKGPDALPVLFKVGDDGKLAEVALDGVPTARAELSKPVAAGKRRMEAITGLKFAAGTLYVAGLSNEEFASTLRALPFPFDGKETAAGVEIFHGAHGKYETAAPVRTFTPIEVDGKAEILAAYTCTPLVRIPVKDITPGAKVKGTTVAELGNRNKPLDIVPYTKDGKPFALIANSARGVMKVSLADLSTTTPITTLVDRTAGLAFERVAELWGVEHLDKLGDADAVLLVRDGATLSIKTVKLP